jgi:hypothetical protein
MERIDEAERARERQAGGDAALAELAQQLIFARAGEALFSEPVRDGFDVGGTHVPPYSTSA